MTMLEFAKRSWALVQSLPAESREGELVIMLRFLAEAGEPLSAIPVSEGEIRKALVHTRVTLGDPSVYWDYAQQSTNLGLVWIWLGQLEAALILRGLDRSAIGVTDAMIGTLIRSLPK